MLRNTTYLYLLFLNVYLTQKTPDFKGISSLKMMIKHHFMSKLCQLCLFRFFSGHNWVFHVTQVLDTRTLSFRTAVHPKHLASQVCPHVPPPKHAQIEAVKSSPKSGKYMEIPQIGKIAKHQLNPHLQLSFHHGNRGISCVFLSKSPQT